MQINDVFHNCPQEQQEQQQSNRKDLGSKCPRSKTIWVLVFSIRIWYLACPMDRSLDSKN